MKINRILKKQAEEIIVYGENQGFSLISLIGKNVTVHHRNYKGKHYDILELEFDIDNKGNTISVFYETDPKEILQILGMEEDYFEKDKNKSI